MVTGADGGMVAENTDGAGVVFRSTVVSDIELLSQVWQI